MTISVVIPTFQRREQVLDAIDSAMSQTLQPTEIVVVDDGSTDGTAEVVTARYGDRVRLLCRPNRGPSAARNAGIEVATGDVVAFLDSDDRWFPHHLAVIAELFARCPTAVLVGTQRDFEWGDDEPSQSRVVDVAEALLLCQLEVGYPTSVAVRRDVVVAAGGFDDTIRYIEDNELFIRLAFLGPFSLISASTFERRRSADSLSNEGFRARKFASHYELSADRALAALDRCPRPDTEALRTAARARRALGAVVRDLAEGATAEAVRPHLAELRRLAPQLDPEAAVLRAVTWVVWDWEVPERRQRMATTLREAGRT